MITYLPTICKTILPGVPCVTQFEIVDTECPRRSFGGRVLRKAMALWAGEKDLHWLFGTLLRDSARTIVLSSPHRDRLVKHYPDVEGKSVIVPPSPLIRVCPDQPATVRQQVRDAIGATERDFVLIYWGYIYPGKGVETLLQAFQIVCHRNENMRLILVGGSLEIPNQNCGDYFQMVQRLSQMPGIADKVTWTGHFNWDSDEGSRYLHAGDACVLPFDYGVTLNNSSLAAASTHGVPVISTELPKGRDEALEHGRNIYLCRPRDPQMLAEAIQSMSENAWLRERLRRGILDLARDWHRWERTTERLVGVLESAVACGKVPGRGQSQSYVATNEAGSSQKSIPSDMRPHYDNALSGVQGENSRHSSLVSSGENTPDNVTAPLVSVIVAVYNVEKYLSQCFDFLVNQTLTNIEMTMSQAMFLPRLAFVPGCAAAWRGWGPGAPPGHPRTAEGPGWPRGHARANGARAAR
jgi:glycosyltransferase involved in cell wall biosynthesis